MPKKAKTARKSRATRSAGIRDELVRLRTGKTWAQWFAILDRAGARAMKHPAIASFLSRTRKVPNWWSQMLTVGYERARGLRAKHQRPEGYSISVTRTIGASPAALFTAWRDPRSRGRWLPGAAITIRKATRPKSMRITWSDRKSSLEVSFLARGRGRGQVAVQHSKLPHARAAAKMKGFWAEKLDHLRETLEER